MAEVGDGDAAEPCGREESSAGPGPPSVRDLQVRRTAEGMGRCIGPCCERDVRPRAPLICVSWACLVSPVQQAAAALQLGAGGSVRCCTD